MKAVIVIDMQNDFITGSLRNEEAIKIVDNMVDYINSIDNDTLVIATRDTHQANYSDTQEGKFLPVSHCIENTNGWEIEKSIMNALNNKNAIIINKPSFGYKQEGWKNLLDNKNIDEIILVGVCTDICVVSNALLLKSLYPETPVMVYKDLCAGVTIDSHNAALTTMQMCQVTIESWK